MASAVALHCAAEQKACQEHNRKSDGLRWVTATVIWYGTKWWFPQGRRLFLAQSLTPCQPPSLCSSWLVKSRTSCPWWSLWYWPMPWLRVCSLPSMIPSSGSRNFPTCQSWAGDRSEGCYVTSPNYHSHIIPLAFWMLTPISLSLLFTCRKYNIRVEDIMVRDVRYITLSSSYRDLQEALITGQLKTLALVESKGET